MKPLILLFTGLLGAAATASWADGFDAAAIQRAHNTVTPAMCIITYTLETRNTQTGEMNRRPGFALGAVVSPDGLIISHGHLVTDDREPQNPTARIGEGDAMVEFPLTLLSKPDDINLTFFRIEAQDEMDLPYMQFAAEPVLELGQPLLIFGLLGEPFDHARAFQTRRVGAILTQPRTTYAVDDSVSFGFVAGPIVNTIGEIVGLLGFDLGRNEGGDIYTRSGHPLVYQASLFRKYIEQPPSEASDRDWAWLGVFSQPLTDDLARYWDLPPEGGIVVSTVVPGSPAEGAGLQAGDVIRRFNRIPITAKVDSDVTAFTRMVRESAIGEPVAIDLLRDGETVSIELTLGERPTAARDAEQFEDDVLGITVRELTTDSRLALNLSEEIEGVLVRGVRSGGPAALGGIRPNFLLMGIGRQPVRNLNEYRRLIELMQEARPEEVTLFCRVGANTAFFRVRPRWGTEE